MHLEKLSNSILFHTKNHLAIRGNIQTRNEIISAFASDMADFLARKKDRRICSNEIIEFFKRHFPQLAVEVQKMNKSQREFYKNISGCFVPIKDKDNNIGTFMLLLEDPSIIVKIKEKFNILENKKFRINPEFLNILVHESTHLMQFFSRKEKTILANILKKNLSPEKFQEISKLFNINIYRPDGKDFIIPIFANDVYRSLSKATDDNPKLILKALKYLIRRTQEEKQAFEIGEVQSELFRSPFLSKFKIFRDITKENTEKSIERFYHFDAKIQALKEEFFALARKIRTNTSNCKNILRTN